MNTGFENIHLLHTALPEVSEKDIDTSVNFLNQTSAKPFFISCMTGGSEGGFKANKNLAKAAQKEKIPVGLGSIRVLFDHPELIQHFHIKNFAPDVPVLANIGGVQVRDRDHENLFELVKRLEVQSLVVHLNPGQELFQPEGDRDFKEIKPAIGRLCEKSPVPVIIKETGFGIHPGLVKDLLSLGAAYIDVAGAGGTNWVTVESFRLPKDQQEIADEFKEWGYPTALLLAALKETGITETGKILASGGIRTGMDIIKSIVLGAHMSGLALPMIRHAVDEGEEGVIQYIQKLNDVIRKVMILTGSTTVEGLSKKQFWMDHHFFQNLRSFLTTVDRNLYLYPWKNEEFSH